MEEVSMELVVFTALIGACLIWSSYRSKAFLTLSTTLIVGGFVYFNSRQQGVINEGSEVTVPIVDLSFYLNRATNSEAYKTEAAKAADALRTFGCVLLKDPRVDETDNDRFVDMLEQYFNVSDGKRDARPELSYQVYYWFHVWLTFHDRL